MKTLLPAGGGGTKAGATGEGRSVLRGVRHWLLGRGLGARIADIITVPFMIWPRLRGVSGAPSGHNDQKARTVFLTR